MPQFEVHQFVHNDFTPKGSVLADKLGVQGESAAGGDTRPLALHGPDVDLLKPALHPNLPGPISGFRY